MSAECNGAPVTTGRLPRPVMDISFRLTHHGGGRIKIDTRLGVVGAWTPVGIARDEDELAVVVGNTTGICFMLAETDTDPVVDR